VIHSDSPFCEIVSRKNYFTTEIVTMDFLLVQLHFTIRQNVLSDNNFQKRLVKIENEIQAIEQKRNRLIDMRLEEVIDKSTYEKKYGEIESISSAKCSSMYSIALFILLKESIKQPPFIINIIKRCVYSSDILCTVWSILFHVISIVKLKNFATFTKESFTFLQCIFIAAKIPLPR
jgi:hypothetical protein